ncbi:MAG: OmpA family protein [Myxococcota bacterium]
MKKLPISFGIAALLSSLAASIHAHAEPSDEADSPPALGRPTSGYFEGSVFAGLLFPSSSNAFYSRQQQALDSPVPELGARAGYYPLEFLGVEIEGAAGPTKSDSGSNAALWGVRGQLIGQLPGRVLTPFALVGAGRLAAGSNATGTDSDPSIHFGVGGKLYLDDFLGLRLDLRDHLTQKYDADPGTKTHHPELLLGLTFTLDTRRPPEPPPPPEADADSDGVPDKSDKCVQAAGPAPDGCPPPADADSDGIDDERDSCPTEAGPAPSGCPEKDADHDCVPLPVDRCPNEQATTPDGCPDPDADHDGVQGAADQCPKEPETKNAFQDDDGCPDTLPAKIQKFSGVIAGIEFDTGKATIRAISRTTLDEAASVLKEFPNLRISIQGHTDNVGPREKNVALSGERADSVKAYLVGKGIDSDRIETKGIGPDQPIADNKDGAGRQKNRRIEFKLLSQ